MSLLSSLNKDAIEDIRHFTLSSGLLMLSNNETDPTNLSVTLVPSPFPSPLYRHALKIQPALNECVDAMSRDDQFIRETFDKIKKSDRFIKRLMDIYNELQSVGNKQTTVIGLHRSDYLIDVDRESHDDHMTVGLKMVEINTIASSYGGHCYKILKLHRYVTSRYLPFISCPKECCEEEKECSNNEECLSVLGDGLATAWKEYGNENAFILFIVGEREINIFDHRQLEYDLWKRYSIPVIRKTLGYIGENAKLTSEREIFVDGKEIAVVYYRCGYVPAHYPTDTEWSGRRLLELSKASNCPSVSYQLIGFKKVQQVLSLPGILERYCSKEEEGVISDIRQTFAGQYSLEQTPEGDKAVQMALTNPHRYVMKPQREGGGNNLYKDDIKDTLLRIKSTDEREQYILMELIRPPAFPNLILKRGETTPFEANVITELGIYGAFVRKGDKILMNSTACGCLIRSKPQELDEGGITIGVAALDAPNLISIQDYCKLIKDN